MPFCTVGTHSPTDIMKEHRSSKRLLRLSEAEYRYLKNGDVADGYIERGGRERTDKLENQVEKKVELLPERFEILFEDVEQLHSGRFESEHDGIVEINESEVDEHPKPAEYEHYCPLDTDAGFDAWLSLMGFEEKPTKREVRNSLTYSVVDRGSAPADFGAKLGLMAHRLMRWPDQDSVENEDLEADLIWGFLEGLCFKWRRAGDLTPELVEETATEILDRMEQRIELAAEIWRERQEWVRSGGLKEIARRSMWGDEKRAMANRVNDILAARDVTSGREVGPEYGERLSGEKGDEEARLCYNIVDYLINYHIESDGRIGTVGQMQEFKEKYGPREDFDVDSLVTEKVVEQIIEEKRPREQAQLMELVKEDTQRLREKHRRRGVSATNVLEEIAEANQRLTSSEIGNQLGAYVGNVTRVAKDLAGVDCEGREQYEVWIDRPLIEGNPGGWQLTNYGEAVYGRLKDSERPWGLVSTTIPDEVVLDAIEEIDVLE